MQKIAIIVLAVLLSACQTNRVVYAPGDVTTANGNIEPVAELLKDKTIKRLRVVFVHGVRDHCPAYAFPPAEDEQLAQVARTAWLDEKAVKLLGLRPRPGSTPFGGTTDVGAFMADGSNDEPSVRYRVRQYDWAMKPIIFEAIEITWSPLTQPIKSNWLGYDAPSVMDKGTKKADGTVVRDDCIPDPDPDVPRIVRPMPRLLINETLKEDVLDRSLADAVIYVGSYGRVISHGVTDALCHAITRNNNNQKCVWPGSLNEDEATTRYVFVTHSLGSRIIFDMFRDLVLTPEEESKKECDPKIYRPGHFTCKESLAANPFVSSMLERTPALYMMANQLPMLGLANIGDANLNSQSLGPLEVATETKKQKIVSGLDAIGALRLKHTRTPIAKMQITAFHDTNDLLTWPLPRWYASETNGAPITFSNVYVINSFHWPWVFEHPGGAHLGYFSNIEVWRAISCGASAGKINDC